MMERKDFLKLSSMGIAGLTAGGFSLSGNWRNIPITHRSDSTLKKGFMLEVFPSDQDYTLLQKFQMLHDAGFDGVEPGSGLNRAEVLEAKNATGLDIPSVVVSTHWSYPLSSPDSSARKAGLEGLKTALYDAHEYGAKMVLLVPGVVTAGVSYSEVYTRSQAEIRKAIPLAEQLGVIIAIENVWNHFLLSPLEAAWYVDEFDSPWVGWYFDVGNILNYGWPEHWIRILGERIKMIHIKEFSQQKRNEEGLYNGFDVNYLEGDNNWPEIMEALREVGYNGYGIAEPSYRNLDTPVQEWLEKFIAGRMDTIFAM